MAASCSPGWCVLSATLVALGLWNLSQELRAYGRNIWFFDTQSVGAGPISALGPIGALGASSNTQNVGADPINALGVSSDSTTGPNPHPDPELNPGRNPTNPGTPTSSGNADGNADGNAEGSANAKGNANTWTSPAEFPSRRHFHFFHMSKPGKSWNWVKSAVLESVFHHHPDAKLTLHLYRDTDMESFNATLAPLRARGYDAGVEHFNVLDDCLYRVNATPSLMERIGQSVMENFLKKLPLHMKTQMWFANQANLGRYCVLYFQGGIYMDTDVLLVKPWPSTWRNTVGLQYEANASRRVEPGVIKGRMGNNAVLQFEAGNPFVGACIVEFLRTFKNNVWGYNGPRLVTKLLDNPEINNTIYIAPSVTFAPLDWFHVKVYWGIPLDHPAAVATAKKIAANSTAVHFYFNMGPPGRGPNLGTKLVTDNCVLCK